MNTATIAVLVSVATAIAALAGTLVTLVWKAATIVAKLQHELESQKAQDDLVREIPTMAIHVSTALDVIKKHNSQIDELRMGKTASEAAIKRHEDALLEMARAEMRTRQYSRPTMPSYHGDDGVPTRNQAGIIGGLVQ